MAEYSHKQVTKYSVVRLHKQHYPRFIASLDTPATQLPYGLVIAIKRRENSCLIRFNNKKVIAVPLHHISVKSIITPTNQRYKSYITQDLKQASDAQIENDQEFSDLIKPMYASALIKQVTIKPYEPLPLSPAPEAIGPAPQTLSSVLKSIANNLVDLAIALEQMK